MLATWWVLTSATRPHRKLRALEAWHLAVGGTGLSSTCSSINFARPMRSWSVSPPGSPVQDDDPRTDLWQRQALSRAKIGAWLERFAAPKRRKRRWARRSVFSFPRIANGQPCRPAAISNSTLWVQYPPGSQCGPGPIVIRGGASYLFYGIGNVKSASRLESRRRASAGFSDRLLTWF
jgi:hypothetical protein